MPFEFRKRRMSDVGTVVLFAGFVVGKCLPLKNGRYAAHVQKATGKMRNRAGGLAMFDDRLDVARALLEAFDRRRL